MTDMRDPDYGIGLPGFPSSDFETLRDGSGPGASRTDDVGRGGLRPEEAGAHDVVVIGGGLSGLSAAWRLDGRTVLLLDQNRRVGGNAGLESRDGLRFATAGTCLQLPVPGSDTAEILRDLGLWEQWRSTADDMLVLFDTKALLKSLGEISAALLRHPRALLDPSLFGLTAALARSLTKGRRFVAAPKRLGEPVFAELFAYLARFAAGTDKHPAVPWHPGSGWTREEMELFDRISLHDLLFDRRVRASLPEGLRPQASFGPLVANAVETTLRVECTSTREVSAYVGLHFLVGYLYGDLVAFPGGNGFVAERLRARLASRRHCRIEEGARAVSIARDGDRHRVVFEQAGRTRTATARAVIWAAPKHAGSGVLPPLPQAQTEAMEQIEYRDYCIANVLLRKPVLERYFGGYAIESDGRPEGPDDWCRSGCCIVANWMDPEARGEAGVLTLLKPVPGRADQGKLAAADFRSLQGSVREEVREMLLASGNAPDLVEDIRIWRWEKGLVAARIGQVADDVFGRASAPCGGIFFANQDSVGIGNLESAVGAGVRSAGQAAAYLDDPDLADVARAASPAGATLG
jgi:protoporphyrinogen oxidase